MAGGSLDEGTKAYLEQRFKSLEDMISTFLKLHQKSEQKTDDLSDEIQEVKTDIAVLKTFKEEHTTAHKEKKSDNKFTVSQIIVIGVVILGAILAFFLK